MATTIDMDDEEYDGENVDYDPAWGDWVDTLEALLRQRDEDLLVFDFDHGDGKVELMLARQLDDYDWTRYNAVRAMLTTTDGRTFTAKADGGTYGAPEKLAEHWLRKLATLDHMFDGEAEGRA